MRWILNSPETLTADALAGLAAAHGDLLRVDLGERIVVRADAPVRHKVSVISGGGSGHEPLHVGFVGYGMLDGACPGAVFSSPSVAQILACMRAVDAGLGVLQIVKNYTGDVLNFSMAATEARDDGMEVASVVIDDDVAIDDPDQTAGRRGTGATLLAERIAGAAAEQRRTLEQVRTLAARVNERARSFGVALSSCTSLDTGGPMFDLPDGEMEVGVGIHGEPGRRRAATASAREIAQIMVDAVLADLQPSVGADLLVFLNGFGRTSDLELYALYGEVDRVLCERRLAPQRRLVGSYMTSLDMAGASLTVLELDRELTALWDAPVHTPALRAGR